MFMENPEKFNRMVICKHRHAKRRGCAEDW